MAVPSIINLIQDAAAGVRVGARIVATLRLNVRVSREGWVNLLMPAWQIESKHFNGWACRLRCSKRIHAGTWKQAG
jgi:hypothetical protein